MGVLYGNSQNINRQRTNSNLSVENREKLIQKYYKENRDELLAHYEKVLKVTSEPNIIDLTEMSDTYKAQNIPALGILPTNSGRISNSSNKRSLNHNDSSTTKGNRPLKKRKMR